MEGPCLDRTEGYPKALGNLWLRESLLLGQRYHFGVSRAQSLDGLSDDHAIEYLINTARAASGAVFIGEAHVGAADVQAD